MARRDKFRYKHKARNEVKLKRGGSEDSDEDYKVDGDEVYESGDEDAPKEGSMESEEDEWVERKVKKVVRSRDQKAPQRRKRIRVSSTRKNKVVYNEGDGHEDFAHEEEDEAFKDLRRSNKAGFCDVKTRKKSRIMCTKMYTRGWNERHRKKNKVLYHEEEEDDDYIDSEEFGPVESDGVVLEEDTPVSKKNNVRKWSRQETRNSRRKLNGTVLNRTQMKRPMREQVFSKKRRSVPGNKVRYNNLRKEKINARDRGQRKEPNVDSESDFVSSDSSDYEFTISEEEREQVREARELRKRLTSNLRSPSSLKMNEEDDIIPSQRNPPRRKGKEKVADVKIQVCGICLCEEGKRTIRGALNCCSHYFCFGCIMEWSKVESRCPLCKQQFATISRTSRVDSGHNFRDAKVTVPQRDQVYEPSEEELRCYLDPYADVLCSECQQGGDDALMLLCDLCDSSAHTYCVGLGREVPEGNWYCDVCRPIVLPSNTQSLIHGAPNCLSVGSSPVAAVPEISNILDNYVPKKAFSQLAMHPRHSSGCSGAAAPSESGAVTLFERRRIQRGIHQFLNNRNRMLERSEAVASTLNNNLLGSLVCQNVLTAPQLAPMQVKTPQQVHFSSEFFSPRSCSFGGQGLQPSTSANHTLPNESVGISERVAGLSGTSNIGADASTSARQCKEVRSSPLGKEQVQAMVKSHLKRLSRNTEIGYFTFKGIARTSTHTILAAVGLEHRPREVHPVQTRPLICDHLERMAKNRHPCLSKDQCSSCFDWFVRNVVKEVMHLHVPVSSTDQSFRKE